MFTPEEIEKFKAEAFSRFSNGKPKYQQPAPCAPEWDRGAGGSCAKERDFGPTAPLVSDEKGDYTRPVNFCER